MQTHQPSDRGNGWCRAARTLLLLALALTASSCSGLINISNQDTQPVLITATLPDGESPRVRVVHQGQPLSLTSWGAGNYMIFVRNPSHLQDLERRADAIRERLLLGTDLTAQEIGTLQQELTNLHSELKNASSAEAICGARIEEGGEANVVISFNASSGRWEASCSDGIAPEDTTIDIVP